MCKIASLVFSDFWQKDRVQGTLKYGLKNFSWKIFFRCKLRIFVFVEIPFYHFSVTCFSFFTLLLFFDIIIVLFSADTIIIQCSTLLFFYFCYFFLTVLCFILSNFNHQVGPISIQLVFVDARCDFVWRSFGDEKDYSPI